MKKEKAFITTDFKNSITNQTRIGEKSIKPFPSGVLFNNFLAGSSINSVNSKIRLEKELLLPIIKSHDIITRTNIKNSNRRKKNIIDCNTTSAIKKYPFI
jgi:hypothetical protein